MFRRYLWYLQQIRNDGSRSNIIIVLDVPAVCVVPKKPYERRKHIMRLVGTRSLVFWRASWYLQRLGDNATRNNMPTACRMCHLGPTRTCPPAPPAPPGTPTVCILFNHFDSSCNFKTLARQVKMWQACAKCLKRCLNRPTDISTFPCQLDN